MAKRDCYLDMGQEGSPMYLKYQGCFLAITPMKPAFTVEQSVSKVVVFGDSYAPRVTFGSCTRSIYNSIYAKHIPAMFGWNTHPHEHTPGDPHGHSAA